MPISHTYLTPDQRDVVHTPIEGRTFLSGPAGTGKTTAGVERVLNLLEHGVSGNQILLLVPQRTLASPYYEALRSPGTPPGGTVGIMTVGGLARRMVDLFWPLISGDAGFANPDLPPVFLTLETAQYYMAHLVKPLLAEGYFDAVTLDRNRLYSQVLDNLSKAAVNGFSHTEIGERLRKAWVGDQGQVHIYADVQDCVNRFRQYCLDNNLLDFSLQIEIFRNQLWPFPLVREHLTTQYRHLVYDNLEEATPVSSDLLSEWLPDFDSALLIYDEGGGYRRFLGADPKTSWGLAEYCDLRVGFEDDFVASEGVRILRERLKESLRPAPQPSTFQEGGTEDGDIEGVLVYPKPPVRFYPDMLDWVTNRIADLVEAGTEPGEIVVLAPYLSDALRYSLVDRLDRLGVPSRSHRPSRALRDEPATRCLLTLAKLAHPAWGFVPPRADYVYALIQAISDLDLVRANLLIKNVLRKNTFSSFETVKPEVQERITYVLGERYEHLIGWLNEYQDCETHELDHFLSRLFGEVLSQPGYGFHGDYNAGGIAASLVESVGKFRRVAGDPLALEGIPLGMEYLQMVDDGVIAAQYMGPWRERDEDSVFLAPAYTFLMANRPVDYQFWLDVGGRGWYDRLYQPLTHPYVLSRNWPIEMPWTDTHETEAGRDALTHLATGLLHRCRRGVYLGHSILSEGGFEQTGDLLRGIDQVVRND